MTFEVLTIFPDMFEGVLGDSIIKRAQEKGLIKIILHNIRDYSKDKHKTVDDYSYGGGPGMVMKVEPIYDCLRAIKYTRKDTWVALLGPRGKKLDIKSINGLSKKKRLILICGHYEGIDERVREFVDGEISIGDFILTGGELPAMVVIDAVSRFIPGVLGSEDSVKNESFSDGLLEFPQYTRPREFRKMKVPDVLLSGNHKEIESWRKKQSVKETYKKRRDLFAKLPVPDDK
ncbi:MAG: tRNA (guanosine(37)-N1)-methyltransferase TrmD [bacterium]|nr:tRNA (guanosine(37)-N1)-methyltransferase TrmD [bacterium]